MSFVFQDRSLVGGLKACYHKGKIDIACVCEHLHVCVAFVFYLGRRKAALYCFYFHRKCPERPERCLDIYIYIYIYIYMSTTWRTQSRYVIFRLYFGKIRSFASDFISEESFRPEEFFEDDFQAIRVSRAVGGPRVF